MPVPLLHRVGAFGGSGMLLAGQLLMSSLLRDCLLVCKRGASPSERGQWFSALSATTAASPLGGNAERRALKINFVLLCPRSPGLTPRSLLDYLLVDSLIWLKFEFRFEVLF
jgi:hypothetical protein